LQESLEVKIECAAHHEPGHIVVAAVQGLRLGPEGLILDSLGEGQPIDKAAGPSGPFSLGGGAVLGAGANITTSGAATVTFGLGVGAEAGVSPQFGTSQFVPFCKN